MATPRANPVRRTNRPADTTHLEPPPPVAQSIAAAPQPEHMGVASNMLSSLPNMASGADVYARQFYRGSKVPFRRYLPIVRQ